jgi:HEAT repeat protein
MNLQKKIKVLLRLSLLTLFLGVSINCFAQSDTNQKFSIDLQKTIEQLSSMDAEQRGIAACRLGEANAESAIPYLVNLLEDSTPIDLVACGNRGKFAKYEPAKSSSPGMEAARSLGAIGKKVADKSMVLDLLFKTLQKDNPYARRNSVLALGIIQNRKALKPLLSVLKDESFEVREKTVWALVSLKENRRAVLPLIGSLSDKNSGVRERAAWALGAIGDERAVLSLLLATQDESASVRERATWALGNFKNDITVNPLIGALQDENASVREKAAWALGTTKAKRAVDYLIEALKDESAEVRERAAWSLGVIKDEIALNDLAIAAKDVNSKVRKRASKAINLIKRNQRINN